VFVIDCTTIGCADPTGTPPTTTVVVTRLEGVVTEFMVEAAPSIGTPRASRPRVTQRTSRAAAWRPCVWIVEDEPAAASLAAELCEAAGTATKVFHGPLPYLAALRGSDEPPVAVVLDWRLERELSAALYMTTRHRHPQLPVIYWTGSPASALPNMIRADPRTMVVDKAGGVVSFERAVAWAISEPSEEQLA
jgi:CheY-like chemotaxis protein